MIPALQLFEPVRREGFRTTQVEFIDGGDGAFRDGFEFLGIEPHSTARFACVKFQRRGVGMELAHPAVTEGAAVQSILRPGIDLPQESGGEPVTRHAADLRNGHRPPAATGAMVEQSFALAQRLQRRAANRANWHGATLAAGAGPPPLQTSP